ncbi:hypothetical protein CR513_53070, partial [Mucuna pruriens]
MRNPMKNEERGEEDVGLLGLGDEGGPRRLEKEEEPSPTPTSKSSNIKCCKFLGKGHIASQCPNKMSMIMQEDEILGSVSSKDESSSISDSYVSNEYSPNDEKDLLMVRPSESDPDTPPSTHTNTIQIKNIKKIKIKDLFRHEPDKGKIVNISSSRLTKKPKLPTLAHIRPYKLQWLNSEGELAVTNKYPWPLPWYLWRQHISSLEDHDNMATRVTNKFLFVHGGQKVTLKPLSLNEVNKDQVKMKLRREKEKKNEKRIKKMREEKERRTEN